MPFVPEVDFKKNMVLAVFLGAKPSGGHSVRVTGVTRSGAGLTVLVRPAAPAPDAITPAVITSPYHLVVVPRAVSPAQPSRGGGGDGGRAGSSRLGLAGRATKGAAPVARKRPEIKSGQ